MASSRGTLLALALPVGAFAVLSSLAAALFLVSRRAAVALRMARAFTFVAASGVLATLLGLLAAWGFFHIGHRRLRS